MSSFDRVISLGTHCYSAWLLRRMGLLCVSYPFDWIFSDLRMNSHVLKDRFVSLLDPALLVEEPNGKAGHVYYSSEFDRKVIFNHHNPLLPQVNADFRRRSERFLSDVARGSSYFFAVSVPERAPVEAVSAIAAALEELCPRFRLDVVVVGGIQVDNSSLAARSLSPHDCATVWDFRPSSLMRGGLAFEADEDNAVLERLVWSRV